MNPAHRRTRMRVAALAAAALCLLLPLLSTPSSAAAATVPAGSRTLDVSAGNGGSALPGAPLTLKVGSILKSTGVAVAKLDNGANGPVLFTIGPCVPGSGLSCTGVLTEISLIANFKDAAGNPLYSDSDPASVSWTCNAQTCPAPSDFAPGSNTKTQLQVEEFNAHPMEVALRNPNGTFQPFVRAPACNGTNGSSIPTGTINPKDTGGRQFCVDVGAISRANETCQTTCSSWSGPLTLPVLFVEDPKFVNP